MPETIKKGTDVEKAAASVDGGSSKRRYVDLKSLDTCFTSNEYE